MATAERITTMYMLIPAVEEKSCNVSTGDDGDRASGRVYIRAFRLHPLVVRVTVEMSALVDDPELQSYHPTYKLIGLAKNLVSINGVNFNLDELQLSQLTEDVSALVQRLKTRRRVNKWLDRSRARLRASGARSPCRALTSTSAGGNARRSF